MRIGSFNLENLDDRPGLAPSLAERIPILRARLHRLDCDLLCLQEVNAQTVESQAPRRLRALERLIADTPYAGYHLCATTSPSGSGPADRHNLVILSRWPILEHRQFRHDLVAPASYRPATAEPPEAVPLPIEWDRPALMATVALPGERPLHLFNLHLRAPLAAPIAGQKRDPSTWKSLGGWAEGFFLAGIKRSGQALETRLAIERIFDGEPEALIAVCGDFNAEDRETPLSIIRGDCSDGDNSHLAARRLIALERGLPDTQRFSVLHGGRRLMLDHLMVSQALMAFYRHIEVHNEALGDELTGEGAAVPGLDSHHAPIVAAFEIR